MGQIIRRKLFRMLALFYPLVYLYYPQKETIYVSAIIAAIALIIESLRFYSLKASTLIEKVFSPIGKEEETKRISGITYLTLGALLTVIFFERVIAVPVLFCTIFGDAASSLIKGKIKISKRKSLEASICCFLTCILIGLVLLKSEILIKEGINFNLILIVSFFVTLFDLLPLSIEDNLSIPLASGFFAKLLLKFFR